MSSAALVHERARQGRVNRATGEAGERVFEMICAVLGWQMDRVQPPTKRVYRGRQLITVCLPGHDGVWDYTGYDDAGLWLACEVKTAHGDTMPCSRVERDQRRWASHKPLSRLFVAILWLDTGRMEVFPYADAGSYRRGKGMAP